MKNESRLKDSEDMVLKLLNKYYLKGSKAYDILLTHSECVARMALSIEEKHPELNLDRKFLYEAAMLHDIGVFRCNAPGIGCTGTEPYIRHGLIGSELLTLDGLPLHSLVCERHTGVGLTLEEIVRRDLPLPHRQMLPVSMEEKVICFADCFYSKTGDLKERKSVERIIKGMAKYGNKDVRKFEEWCRLFL